LSMTKRFLKQLQQKNYVNCLSRCCLSELVFQFSKFRQFTSRWPLIFNLLTTSPPYPPNRT
jgi:hypothetical protein